MIPLFSIWCKRRSLSTHTSAVCYWLACCRLLRFSQQLLHSYKKPPPWRGSGWPVHCCYLRKPWKQRRALSFCCFTDGSLSKFPFCLPGARGQRYLVWSTQSATGRTKHWHSILCLYWRGHVPRTECQTVGWWRLGIKSDFRLKLVSQLKSDFADLIIRVWKVLLYRSRLLNENKSCILQACKLQIISQEVSFNE